MRRKSIQKIRATEKGDEEVRVVDVSKRRKKGASRLRLKGVALLLAAAAVASAFAVPAAGKQVVSDVLVQQGPSDMLGGGSFVSYEREGSSVQIIYGDQEANSLFIVHSFPRRVAELEAYNPDGSYEGRFSMDVETVAYHELRYLLEYEGVPATNIGDWNDLPQLGDDVAVKALSLDRSWELLDQRDVGDGTYRVSLGLTDPEYDQVWRGDGGRVSRVVVTVTTKVTETATTVSGLPWHRVDLKQAEDGVALLSTEPLPGKPAEARLVTWSTKYSLQVDGWDFDGGASRLLLASRTFLGERPSAENAEWADDGLTDNIKAEAEPVGIDTEHLDAEEVPSLSFRDNWEERAVLSWEGQELTVDGQGQDPPDLMLLQAEDASVRIEDQSYSGVALDGVFAYPQGESIRHDPTIVSRFFEFEPMVRLDLLPAGSVLAQVAVGALGTIAAYAMAMKRGPAAAKRKEEEGDEEDETEP